MLQCVFAFIQGLCYSGLGRWGGRVIAFNSITVKFESAGRQQSQPTQSFSPKLTRLTKSHY